MEPGAGTLPEPSRWSNPVGRRVLFWLILVLLAVVLWKLDSTPEAPRSQQQTYSTFLDQVDKQNVRSVRVYPSQDTAELRYQLKDTKSEFSTTSPAQALPALTDKLRSQGEKVAVQNRRSQGDWHDLLINALPLILLVTLWIFTMRRAGWKGAPK